MRTMVQFHTLQLDFSLSNHLPCQNSGYTGPICMKSKTVFKLGVVHFAYGFSNLHKMQIRTEHPPTPQFAQMRKQNTYA